MIKGKIIKGIGGFYYVETADAVYECKARGNFRKMNLTPLVGDDVEISVNDNSENRIENILPRRNSLVRPPLANLEQLFIIASIVDPAVNTFIIDKLIAIAEYKKIEPIIVFTKIDLDDSYTGYENIYRQKKYVGGATRGPRGWGRPLLPRGVPDFYSKSSGLLSVQ